MISPAGRDNPVCSFFFYCDPEIQPCVAVMVEVQEDISLIAQESRDIGIAGENFTEIVKPDPDRCFSSYKSKEGWSEYLNFVLKNIDEGDA